MKDGIPLGEMIAQLVGPKFHHGRETLMLGKIPFSEARMTTHPFASLAQLKKTDKQGTCLDGGPFHGLYRVQMRIAIDAMGGDNAPSTIIDELALAVKNNLSSRLFWSALSRIASGQTPRASPMLNSCIQKMSLPLMTSLLLPCV